MAKRISTTKPFEFDINGEVWEIVQLPQISEDVSTVGETQYHTRTITLLDWVDKTTKMRTLKHELAHVWLWEYGHNQQEKEFNHEDVCEIIASSNDFINTIISDYFKGGI